MYAGGFRFWTTRAEFFDAAGSANQEKIDMIGRQNYP
jgi:hypothetical protein